MHGWIVVVKSEKDRKRQHKMMIVGQICANLRDVNHTKTSEDSESPSRCLISMGILTDVKSATANSTTGPGADITRKDAGCAYSSSSPKMRRTGVFWNDRQPVSKVGMSPTSCKVKPLNKGKSQMAWLPRTLRTCHLCVPRGCGKSGGTPLRRAPQTMRHVKGLPAFQKSKPTIKGQMTITPAFQIRPAFQNCATKVTRKCGSTSHHHQRKSRKIPHLLPNGAELHYFVSGKANKMT